MNMEEWEAMQQIAKDKSITILPADEGRTTVVMDTEQYEEQMLTHMKYWKRIPLKKKRENWRLYLNH